MSLAAIQTVIVPTMRGAITVVGRLQSFCVERPLILVIPGALQAPSSLFGLITGTPQADVALALLPGMFAPMLSETSIEAFAQAFDEVVQTRFAGRVVLRLGFSAGGLAAMAMREGQAFVAVDSPLNTARLWPLIAPMRAEMAKGESARLPQWAWAILGISAERIENRDYRPLLSNLNVPGLFVIAGQPLEPPRPLPGAPGALTDEDRELVSSTPGISTIVAANGGHDILISAPKALRLAITRGLELVARKS